MQLKVQIPEKFENLLIKFELAAVYPDTNELKLHPKLTGEKYCPGFDCDWISPFSPQMFAAILSHMNVQVCNGRIVLVKYAASEEERCLVK